MATVEPGKSIHPKQSLTRRINTAALFIVLLLASPFLLSFLWLGVYTVGCWYSLPATQNRYEQYVEALNLDEADNAQHRKAIIQSILNAETMEVEVGNIVDGKHVPSN